MTDPADHTEAMAGAQITEHLRRVDAVVLGGRYELSERIASGGMASVWRAHDEVLARTVAVKLLHDHLAADEDFRERFRREAIAAAKLTHPNVVSLYDTGSDGDRVYLVMEFVDGATLREVINDLKRLECGQAAAIGERVARALDYAHDRGLVHRDIKPANILIGDDGAVKVADFGIAKADEHDGDLTKTGMVLGTAAYVAPEQITGQGPIDGRADQYALGCMLYEALTGRQPFKGDTAVATAAQRLESSPAPLRSFRPDIPRGLDAIVMRAMARDPEDRFVSAGAMADALAAFADPDDAHTAALPHATAHRAAQRRQHPLTPPAGIPTSPPLE
ncbi:MAG TPA: protein kinase, partial [Egibacteraceae bacterium]|nr:protein kinase [Egibacteraceae bacterium]